MPSFLPRKVITSLPFALLLGLVPVASFSAPGCGGAAAVCGDARVALEGDGAEECDDGNLTNDDECTNECKLPKCGDGIFQQAANNEECDDGNEVDTDACTNLCTLPVCGDGVVREGVEECDDGNLSNTDDCLETCLLATCGDTFIHNTTKIEGGEANLEECDDGNDIATDNCTTQCKKPVCGDSFVWTGFEQCDDGNTSDTDACPSTCVPATCGDGFVNAPEEECDDKNQIETDDCLPSCKKATCGDGIVNAPVEECDDGNDQSGDYCANNCKRECPVGEIFDGSCYIYFQGPVAFAEANCNLIDAHLVTIYSAAENDHVQNLLPDAVANAWIGLKYQGGIWLWQVVPLAPPVLAKWAAAQPDFLPAPDATCAIIDQASGLWFDQPCAELRGFVCEHDY